MPLTLHFEFINRSFIRDSSFDWLQLLLKCILAYHTHFSTILGKVVARFKAVIMGIWLDMSRDSQSGLNWFEPVFLLSSIFFKFQGLQTGLDKNRHGPDQQSGPFQSSSVRFAIFFQSFGLDLQTLLHYDVSS